MPEDKGGQSPPEPTPAPTPPTPPATVELGESVRKGTQVMPELSVPQNFDPPSAAPIAGAPASDPTPPAPAPSGGSDGSSSTEK
jgi:hypothetical protein